MEPTRQKRVILFHCKLRPIKILSSIISFKLIFVEWLIYLPFHLLPIAIKDV